MHLFRVSPAEELPIENGSAQLLVACMAAHWFDLPKFFDEANRVLCTYGVVALTGYFLPHLADEEHAEKFNACLKNVTRILAYNKSLNTFFVLTVLHTIGNVLGTRYSTS